MAGAAFPRIASAQATPVRIAGVFSDLFAEPFYAKDVGAFAKAGLAGAALAPVAYASFNNPVQRPMYSPLANTTFAALGLSALPGWDVALDEFLEARCS